MRKGKRILLIAGIVALCVNSASASLFRHRSAEKSAPQAQAQSTAEPAAMSLTAIDVEQSPARIVLKTSGDGIVSVDAFDAPVRSMTKRSGVGL